MRLVFSTAAQRERLVAIRYYEDQRPGLGAELFVELNHAPEFMRRYPEGSPLEAGNVRNRLLKGFPFALFYPVRHDNLMILPGAHTHRQPRQWESV